MAQALAGLILAGGSGERYGGPKAFARLPDRATFLERCAATLVAAGAAPVIATVPPGTAVTAPVGVDIVPLPAAGLDMLASIRVGLSRLLDTTGWLAVAILPVDHPDVDRHQRDARPEQRRLRLLLRVARPRDNARRGRQRETRRREQNPPTGHVAPPGRHVPNGADCSIRTGPETIRPRESSTMKGPG